MKDPYRYWLVTLTGHYLTPNNTWTLDPARALKAERWWLEYNQPKMPVMTVIIRAA